jgi:hypothetical protein
LNAKLYGAVGEVVIEPKLLLPMSGRPLSVSWPFVSVLVTTCCIANGIEALTKKPSCVVLFPRMPGAENACVGAASLLSLLLPSIVTVALTTPLFSGAPAGIHAETSLAPKPEQTAGSTAVFNTIPLGMVTVMVLGEMNTPEAFGVTFIWTRRVVSFPAVVNEGVIVVSALAGTAVAPNAEREARTVSVLRINRRYHTHTIMSKQFV